MDKLPEDEAVSYLPTSTEMAQAVKWVKKNPALAIGVVAMGITSLSVAKYLEEDEEQNQPDEESKEEPEDSTDNPQPLPEPMEPVLTLKTYKGRGIRTQSDMTVLCEDAENSPRVESRIRGDAAAAFSEMQRHCSFCKGDRAASNGCCDPDWGWFVGTSPPSDAPIHAIAKDPASL